uniref:CCT-beta n=1 Tax=Physarum polycephalum TaxID=5791 RepID=Q8WSY6_PHYPO|nr:CCT chaperonin beta subunit [Physarum polycephalum]
MAIPAGALQPVQILESDSVEEKGENARLASFVGAIALTDLVKTTLGPKGMDKILQSQSRDGNLMVTNDGATILKSIYLDNAAAKILVDISKTQDDEVGDGTTSVCVLAGELLREGEKLIQQKIHPQTIISGWRLAVDVARKHLLESARDHSTDKERFRQDLLNIARTTLSSKIVYQGKDHFANLAVDAVLRLKGSTNLDYIHIIKKAGGSIHDSYLEEGFILEKKIGVGSPKSLANAKILVANTSMDTDKIKINGKVTVTSPAELAAIEDAERAKMIAKCDKIIKHGVNVFVNRQLVYNLPEQYLADHGVMVIEHADFDGIERIARVTGGEIASTFDHPDLVKLGECKLIEEIMIGEDQMIRFSGVPVGGACTIVLRGATSHMLDETERSLHDALCVLSQVVSESKTVFGGGCAEMIMSKAIDEVAKQTPGKKALALDSFSKALRQIPTILADNGGYDSGELVSQLRAEHYKGHITTGLNMKDGSVGDMEKLGILEALKVKQQVLISAAEAAEMILRVDNIIRAAPRKREADPRMGGY